MAALEDFYDSLGGAQWKNNSNWLEGDPCANFWNGLACVNYNVTGMFVVFSLSLSFFFFFPHSFWGPSQIKTFVEFGLQIIVDRLIDPNSVVVHEAYNSVSILIFFFSFLRFSLTPFVIDTHFVFGTA